MTHATPISSRKRSSSEDESESSDLCTNETRPTKRQRASSSATAVSSVLPPYRSGKTVPPTPPTSAKRTIPIALKLFIPRTEIDEKQQRQLNRRKVDAERWEPKLQRPYPNKTEIKQAYTLKLMRHYPSLSAQSELNFVKPKVDHSPRVSRLLKQFPFIDTTQSTSSKRAELPLNLIMPLDKAQPLSSRADDLVKAQQAHVELQANIDITKTEHARRLAWQSFSQTEHDRIDRGREAMMQSGLFTDDLVLENDGRRNRLPEWRKTNTGRFAREYGAAK